MTEKQVNRFKGDELSNSESSRPAELESFKQTTRVGNFPALLQGATLRDWTVFILLIGLTFLLFPAYRGFIAGREIRRLNEEVASLNHSLWLSKTQVSKLENDLYQLGMQGHGRRIGDHLEGGLGLFVSPLLSLGEKKAGLPDLIRIDFKSQQEAVLAFELPRPNIEDLQMRITREESLVWLQDIPLPSRALFDQNLITFVLSRETLGPGDYQIKLEGNAGRKKALLGEFDLTIER